MTKRSPAQIELDIMMAIRKGSEKGCTVNAHYIKNQACMDDKTFSKYTDSLLDKRYVENHDGSYILTERADGIVKYFRRDDVADLERFSAEKILSNMAGGESFSPKKIVRREQEQKRMNKDQLMFGFVNRVKSSGENGSTISYINKALTVSPATIIKCGQDAEKNGYVFTISQKKGGRTFRKFYTTYEGEEWLTSTPEMRALSKIVR